MLPYKTAFVFQKSPKPKKAYRAQVNKFHTWYYMAATIGATLATLNLRCFTIKSSKNINTSKPTTQAISLLSLKQLPKSFTLTYFKPLINSKYSTSLKRTAIASTILSTLIYSDPAVAAQQIADAAEGDNRVLALLLPIIPAILWVLYNILGPALNQINRMRSEKGVIMGLGLGGLAASSFFLVPNASASEVAMIGEASSDYQGLVLWFVVTPALWVLYKILQPSVNQTGRIGSV